MTRHERCKTAALASLMVCMLLLTVFSALAVTGDFADLDQGCYGSSESATGIGVLIDFGATTSNVTERTVLNVKNSCESSNEISFTETVDLVLGPIQDDEVIIADDFIYVDSSMRPDLNENATITFRDQSFVVTPDLLRDGMDCGGTCTGEQYNTNTRTFTANVSGFSNYSLTARQDFNLWSDEQPELQGKVYQVIDLGDTYRGEEFSCVVMIFAEDRQGELSLVQTNPERKVQGRLFGDTDQQQPESLGYFPTRNGVANVYFRQDLLVGYTQFEYVAQCQNNATQLIYEETIEPVNTPLGRNFASRAVWLTTDNNGKNSFFLVLYVIGGVIAFWLFVLFVRKTFGGS